MLLLLEIVLLTLFLVELEQMVGLVALMELQVLEQENEKTSMSCSSYSLTL
jgi:hypothetical protein